MSRLSSYGEQIGYEALEGVAGYVEGALGPRCRQKRKSAKAINQQICKCFFLMNFWDYCCPVKLSAERQTVRADFLSEAGSYCSFAVVKQKTKDYGQRYDFHRTADARGTSGIGRSVCSSSTPTTITPFSNLLFKGAGRNPKTGKKKGGLKVHEIIQANEGVPCDVCFTSAARHDSFMLVPEKLSSGDILAMDRAYIDYDKLQRMAELGVTYVTKMKQNLRYTQKTDIVYPSKDAMAARREQEAEFVKMCKYGTEIHHRARIITCYDKQKAQLISLLTNDPTSGRRTSSPSARDAGR